jgi:DNA-directed RNA polymerase specialized sigma24 family protein
MKLADCSRDGAGAIRQEAILPLVRGEIRRLAALDAQQARVVELRILDGLTVEQTAVVLGISPAAVRRD